MGAWIEIVNTIWSSRTVSTSLPLRERGLKSEHKRADVEKAMVAPFTGAWIEIMLIADNLLSAKVAPFTGAWIEIRLS